MIYDKIEYLSELPLSKNICRKISRFIESAAQLPDGKHEIDGKLIYASKFSYITVTESVFEAHQRYADLQILLTGEERLGVTQDVPALVRTPYDETGDAVLYSSGGIAYSTLIMRPGYFSLLFPRDIHMPGLSIAGAPSPVTKIVVKIAAELLETKDSGSVHKGRP